MRAFLLKTMSATKRRKKHKGFANTFAPFVLLCGYDPGSGLWGSDKLKGGEELTTVAKGLALRALEN